MQVLRHLVASRSSDASAFTGGDESFLFLRDGAIIAGTHSPALTRIHVREPLQAIAGADVSCVALGESGRVYVIGVMAEAPMRWRRVYVHQNALSAPVTQVLASAHSLYARDEQGLVHITSRYLLTTVEWTRTLLTGERVTAAVACREGVVLVTSRHRACTDMRAMHAWARDVPWALYPLTSDEVVRGVDVGPTHPILHIQRADGHVVPHELMMISYGLRAHAGEFALAWVSRSHALCGRPLRVRDGRLYYYDTPLPLPEGVAAVIDGTLGRFTTALMQEATALLWVVVMTCPTTGSPHYYYLTYRYDGTYHLVQCHRL